MMVEIKKGLLLSFSGGIAGGLESLIAYLFSFITVQKSLLFDFIVAGVVFSIVGVGLIMSFILILPQKIERKTTILFSGAICGFLAGLFFHFGMGLYFGIIILSVFIGCTLRLLHLTTSPGRIILGGILGGFSGVGLSAFSFLVQTSSGSILSTIFSTAVITYCVNLGMISFYKPAYKNA
jgi:hypothetical protein